MAKNIGFGSLFGTSTGAIGQVVSMSFSGMESADVETTALDSTTNYRQYKPGLQEPGELSVQVQYDKILASHKALTAHFNSQTVLEGFYVGFNGSTTDTDTFGGYVKSLSREVPLGELLTATFTIKLSAAPGLTVS